MHDLFQERVASKTPYITKELLKDARKLLELDLILLVGSDLTWDKTQRGVDPRTQAASALIRPPQAASGGGVNDDKDGDEDSEDNDDDDNNEHIHPRSLRVACQRWIFLLQKANQCVFLSS